MARVPFHFGLLQTPCFMGIVNITPNSFSDTGEFLDPQAAITHARLLASQGAQILDLGAEASSFFRPGVSPVDSAEQLRRLQPVLAGLRYLHTPQDVFLSIDTRSGTVARQTLGTASRVAIINDISAGTHDPAMLAVVAQHDAAIILMHISPHYPATPTCDDPDILGTVRTYLAARIAAARAAGIPPNRIAIDPGLGFGKTMHDNWILALRAHELLDLDVPVILGASRKRFLESPPPPALIADWSRRLAAFPAAPTDHPRDAATAALTRFAVQKGIPIHRVHNVSLAKNSSIL